MFFSDETSKVPGGKRALYRAAADGATGRAVCSGRSFLRARKGWCGTWTGAGDERRRVERQHHLGRRRKAAIGNGGPRDASS